MPKFKQHDWVDFAGIRGVVLTTKGSNVESPVQVVFAKQKSVLGFRKDGTFGGKVKIMDLHLDWGTDLALKLVKRPSKSLFQRIKDWWKRERKTKSS